MTAIRLRTRRTPARTFPGLPLLSTLAVLVLSLASAPAALAGIHYQQETTSSPDNAAGMTAEVWIDQEKGRIEIRSSANPILPAGSYIVTQDGGRTFFLVDPEAETYSRFDVNAMLGAAGAMLDSLGGVVDFEFSQPQIEVLDEGAGDEVLGMSTRYLKQRVTYDMTIKVLGMKRSQQAESTTEMWIADIDSEHRIGMWLRTEPPRTGNAQLDEVIAAQSDFPEGVPLRTRTTTVSRQMNRKGEVKNESTSVVEMRVTSFEEVDTSGIDYSVPAGFAEVPMMVPGATDEEGGNPLSGLFKRDGG